MLFNARLVGILHNNNYVTHILAYTASPPHGRSKQVIFAFRYTQSLVIKCSPCSCNARDFCKTVDIKVTVTSSFSYVCENEKPDRKGNYYFSVSFEDLKEDENDGKYILFL